MDFKTLFTILKKHMADGDDVPYFFREIMAMITTVKEDEWGTSKDPSCKYTNDETIRSYTKRGLPKKLAQAIVYRLTPDVLIERINEREPTVRELLADDFYGYDPTIDADNVAQKVADWLVGIIQAASGLISQDELQRKKAQQQAAELKLKYGSYLLAETEHCCPFPGCGRSLTISENGRTIDSFEVSLIDKTKAPEVNNLLALCPRCHATYQLDDSKAICKELRGVKTVLATHKQSVNLLDDLPLEKGIIGVIRRIKKLSEKDLFDASLDPKEIRQKISPAENMALYISVSGYVSTYFIRIREIMTNLDKSGEIDYDEIQDQMHALYKRLKKKSKSQIEIFNEISGKIHKFTLQEDTYCQIVVAYFIQSCEVFDAITE